MKKIVFRTLDETKQLAKKLQGKTDFETVKNIKEFVYWHIQYLQDLTDQQLYSPSRTWANRSTGVDCKSYSIIVSSILTNLGIENSLRQIKQVNYKPEYWTHVYVFLPAHNLVIDGTVPYNQEPLYIEKFDELILENGLNGLSQLSCNNTCDYRTSNTPKGRLPFKNLAQLLAESNTDTITSQAKQTSSEIIHVVTQLKVPELPPKKFNYPKHIFIGVLTASIVALIGGKKENKKK
ncbi:hypothetical protein JJL45_09215 [Tamlana sp. s12]|uniref:transglutaminase-like domain-containing protein n=1 Tax=Tamlana sp. s12 TaxID=1630406 RepID=UPI0007FE4A3C|nr:transglutaminase-like domain-containing protein [Tamlana sp. s12]OBQ52865.1 hypothetical protein VQ01_13030 [Tamlana sp. s12]QQY81109.1 hypothetical protein JJL45_09215 [Tamlana sp. s12]